MTTELTASPPRQQRRPISRSQMEVVASRSVAFFGLLFGAQTFPVMLGQVVQLQPVWFWGYNIAILGGLLVSVVAAMLRRFVRSVNTWVALSYLVAMATWPLAVLDTDTVAKERPWLWFMCTVATAAAAIAFSTWSAALYLVLAPSVYGVIRLTPSGGGAHWDLAALDTIYAILLGGAVLMIITLLRGAAASVDSAQATALARYSHAIRQHATEVERVQVDSIVHDSVLTTLISAARAYSPDAMALSATMASNAIGHLKEAAAASPDDESMVAVEQVAERIAEATNTLSAPFTVRVLDIGAGTVSVQVADALYSAAVQAMVNSLQHAGHANDIDRWVRITGVGADGLEVEIGDTGVGFSIAEVPNERLGLRVSIVERVANAGGRAEIASSPGDGTVVSIRWPDPEQEERGTSW
ncbi:signal transduction histidine kinase [Cryobacterium mesophilum]|uniref:Histidine kinase n=1 Tax=Terrimesophilobacter mesophilus TaxID=433647 RepID=A0A4R8V8N1_9MICO|nr:ATP-binding protein [Terrimesophilobacter mesophilus]MBB5632695.1 signal transduction histidine kinase [Terrimesophilobacter mesophilus]TFB79501.1 histidine kinase [Terrimesophilobacter mesophilus]